MNKKPTKRMALRSHIAFFAFCGALLLLIGNLFWIQIINGEEYRLKAERNQLSDTIVSANRGTIYDSNMKVLAQSASAWLVYINPSKITTDEQKQLLLDYFVENFNLNEETVQKKLDRESSGYEKIIGQISNDQKTALREFLSENTDKHKLNQIVGIDPDTKRYYPLGSFASTVLGFTGSEDTGRAGIELKYNTELTGQSGRIITAQNAMAGDMPNDYETVYDAQQGYSLQLTIDEVIQYYLEQQLSQSLAETEAKYAYGIIMDVETGAILAMATMPDYDLNQPYKITSNAVLEEIQSLEESEQAQAETNALYSQWRNRAISDSYEPGSVFKLFVAAAALEEGIITPDYTYNCAGSVKVANYYQHCFNHKAHGNITVAEALPYSCNTFFITTGQKMGKELFSEYFDAFGFTEKTGIDLPSEAAPVAGKTYYDVDSMGIAELSSASFGQTFQATPIQMITAVASLGNGGKLMTPYVVAKVLDENGNIVSETEPTVKRQVVSEETASLMCEFMEEVVVWGTAKNAYVAGYHIAGKTGTSEKLNVKGENIASFAGFAPANDPKIAVLIAVDEPKEGSTGGSAAAPIAGRIFENILAYLNIDPQYSDEELAKATVTAPNLVGTSADKVKSKATGFTVKIVGEGTEVVSQMPSQNQSMPKGGIIVVYTEENAERQTATVPDLTGLTMSEANRIAVNAGFNIKIAGTTQGEGNVVSYKQSIEKDTVAEVGTIITVYFSSSENVAD